MKNKISWFAGLSLLVCGVTFAADWPQWGRTPQRNFVSDAKNLPDDFNAGEYEGRTDRIDRSTTKGVKWIAKLGSQAYGNPTVSQGRVLVGTNNESPRDPKYKGDRSTVYCLDEKTGELVWQLSLPKLGAGKVGDWEFLGICSSPAIDGDRVYIVTNLCEVLCLDLNGLADGNQGVTDEKQYLQLPDDVELGAKDADVIWRYDMRKELFVFPHNITSSSVLISDGAVYATTSNGVDWSHVDIPNKQAPTLVKLDAGTGELLAEEASGISERLMHSNWSSPAYGEVDGAKQIFFGGGDGYLYGFSPDPVEDEDGYPVFKELWRVNCCPDEYRFNANGEPIKYATAGGGPSEIIGTPVYHNGRVFVSIGQDPEHGEGVGAFTCIDPTQATPGTDEPEKGVVWQSRIVRRSISTPSIADGLVYIADYSGNVHCFDEKTGDHYWSHDTFGHIWGSTLVADGKVYIGNEDGVVTILKAGKEKEVIREIEFPSPIYSTPIVANDVLYISTTTHLYAIDGK